MSDYAHGEPFFRLDVQRQARGPGLNYREEVGSDTALGHLNGKTHSV